MAYLWQLSQIELNNKIWITGSLLKGNHRARKTPSNILGHFFQLIRSYNKSAAKNIRLKFITDKEEKEIVTGSKGNFSILLARYDKESLQILEAGEALEIPSDYPTYFPSSQKPLEVISDIDDTILHSNTASAIKRISNILFILPKNRKTVVYTYQLFQCFQEMGFRINYLSKSESNLFGLISEFIQFHELPQGPLLLTPHLKWRQLPKPNKGKDYKLDHLKQMLSEMSDKKFILLGDDSQRDMEIYTSIVKQFQDRIVKIFIRQTGFSRSEKQNKLWAELQKTKVEAIYFDDSEEAKEEIARLKALKL